MQIRPLYDRLVVRRIEQKETVQNGIIIPDSAQREAPGSAKSWPLAVASAWKTALWFRST